MWKFFGFIFVLIALTKCQLQGEKRNSTTDKPELLTTNSTGGFSAIFKGSLLNSTEIAINGKSVRVMEKFCHLKMFFLQFRFLLYRLHPLPQIHQVLGSSVKFPVTLVFHKINA